MKMKMKKPKCQLTHIITFLSLSTTLLLLLHLHIQSSLHLFTNPNPNPNPTPSCSLSTSNTTFLPLKDLSLSSTPMDGTTWFMSSLNDTILPNQTLHLHFPSNGYKNKLLCLNPHNTRDGTNNSYALTSLAPHATLLKGLTFVSDTYYDYSNMWHGLSATAPFAGWSIKNRCARPSRWVLFHRGELRTEMGSWVRNVMEASFGEVKIEGFGGDDRLGPYCLEEAVVMRHNLGGMGREEKREVSGMIRCRSRERCRVEARGREMSDGGQPVIRFTLLLRRGARSFKNETAVIGVFGEECRRVEGCVFEVVQSEDLSFCDQVRVMSNTDIVASPHGAQLTNMLFMDPNSSVMEFFPRGWLEFAGVGRFAHHWMAELSGLTHRGAWWDPLGDKDCPNPQDDVECFKFYKQGKVGHNITYFAEWARTVLEKVRYSKLQGLNKVQQPRACAC